MKSLERIFQPDEVSQLSDLTKFHHDLSAMSCVENAPKHVQENVELAKNLLLYSHFVFEFATAAVHYMQIALEASLRRALGKSEDDRNNIKTIVEEARDKGMLGGIDPKLIMLAQITPRSRNGFAHGKEGHDVFNHALAVPYAQAILVIINVLFASSRPSVQINGNQTN